MNYNYKATDILYLLEKLKICKDVRKIIKNLLFEKCIECKNYERFVDLSVKYDNKYICKKCNDFFDYKECDKCDLLFKNEETKFCKCCGDYCKYYCNFCFDADETMRFFNN